MLVVLSFVSVLVGGVVVRCWCWLYRCSSSFLGVIGVLVLLVGGVVSVVCVGRFSCLILDCRVRCC